MIELKGISAKQGGFRLSVEGLLMRKGDFVAVLGNNGSGKSTFLSVLAGLKKFKGKYLLEGQSFQSISPLYRHRIISFLPQQTSLNMPFDVHYVVLTGRYPYTNGRNYKDEDIRATERILKEFDIFHLRHRQFNELSGGEKQRALLARVINRNSPIILLDEPLSGIDLKHQHEILNFLKRLCKDRIILIVIHDISLAIREFDRFLFFVKGTLAHDLQKRELDEEKLTRVFGVKVNFIRHKKGVFVYIEGDKYGFRNKKT